MSHPKNKFKWCLKKAEKELQHGSKHRGLIKIKPDPELVEAHIKKSEHNLIKNKKSKVLLHWSLDNQQ